VTPQAVTQATPARKRIGKYDIVGRIGRGGMGQVYRGWDALLEREVAVKTLTSEGMLDEESRKRFQIEARAAARLQHPNIVTVFELGEERGTPYIVMEVLGGADLQTLMRSGDPLLLQEKLDTLVQVCRALHYAHEHQVVHRDMKPSNIRLLEDGTAKIMDFGIAKLQGTDVTKTGMMVGTVHYMSPEQVRGLRLDGRSDVFSAGVILYELLAGQRPFKGASATDILTRIVREPAGPIPSLPEGGDVTRELQQVVDRALAKDVAQRYATAGEMADALAALGARLPRTSEAPTLEIVNASRRLAREGRYEESLRRLEEATAINPISLEARRALRTIRREAQKRQEAVATEKISADDFPELADTFQASPTRVEESTRVDGTAATHVVTEPGSARPVAGGRGLLVAAGALVLVAALTGLVLVLRPDAPGEPPATMAALPPVSTPAVTAPPATIAGVTGVRLPVASEPAGAQVALDDVAVGTTPLVLSLAPGRDHTVRVTLADHETQELRVLRDAVPPKLDVALAPAGPPGSVRLESTYPVDVTWRGRTLAKGERSPVVKLSKGRQSLTVTSAMHALRATVNVEVRAGETVQWTAPPLGPLNVRAVPDNCQVFVDGVFLDYPPILDRQVAAGRHTVEFRWADGGRQQEEVEVKPGTPAYVMGRKD
jgi:serine/threonine protein kinase